MLSVSLSLWCFGETLEGFHAVSLSGALQVVVQLTEDLLSQAVMTTENSRPTLTINLLAARQYWLEGVLRHEIGVCKWSHPSWHVGVVFPLCILMELG